ncbi:MAG: hypothetical protein K2G07_06525 [Muribaculaceae bacterium]|nr:hypothetical protein [Muribaculaceae bacterium]
MKLNDNVMFPYPVKGIADNVISPPIEVEISDESSPSEYVFNIRVISLNDADIQNLIDEDKAVYSCEISCSYTMLLRSVLNKQGNFRIRLPLNRVGKIIYVTVAVIAKEPIPNYINENFHPDFKGRGFVFNLNPGEVLAKVATFHVDADISFEKLKAIESILVVRQHHQNDEKFVDVNCDGDKIEVLLPEHLYLQFKDGLAYDRRYSSSFHASFVLQALTIAITHYQHYLNLEKLWARVLNARFSAQSDIFSEFDLSGDIDIEDASRIAQIILSNPYERMFKTLLTLDN